MRTMYGRVLVAAIAALAMACAALSSAEGQSPKRPTRILILYSLAPESPTAAVFIARLHGTLRAELITPVEIFQETLDIDRFPDPQRWQQFLRFYRDKYRRQQPDLVVAIGTLALEFAVDHLRRIMPGVPIVFGMVQPKNDRVDFANLPPSVTGRFTGMTLGQSLAMAKRLQPDANRVVVIGGSSPLDSVALSDALADSVMHRHQLRMDRWQGLPYDSLLRALRGLSPRTIVYFAYFRRDGGGRTMVPLDALAEIARESRAPVYGFADAMIGTGVVGGAMWRHDDEAVQTGRLAARVLRRAAGAPLPPVQSAGTPFMADWRVLRRFGWDEQLLPPGTEVFFRTPSFWERHGEVILVALVVILVESLLIGLLLLERRRRIRAQSAMADQAKYERTMAELMADASRHAPEDAPRALEDAIARVGRYADADEVVLVQSSDALSRPPLRHEWTRTPNGASDGSRANTASARQLEFPLVVAGETVGMLTLRRATAADDWRPHLVDRLASAAAVLAGAIARSSASLRADEAGRQVAHLGRVATIGELAATISHELRQPLAAIRINVEAGRQLLARKPLDLGEVRRVFDDIVADNDRAAEVIDQTRALLRKELPARSMVDLNEICGEAVDLLRRDAKHRGIRLDLTLDARLPAVQGQSIELRQVALNLIMNALDAAAMSGGPRWVAVHTTGLQGLVELRVCDSGPGLSADARNRLFEPFFTTKPHGLGMGLVIVRSIVERNQGRIQVENGENAGAVFRVRLPVREDAGSGMAVPAMRRSSSEHAAPTRG